MTERFGPQLKDMMRKEVFDKGRASSIAFAVFAAFSFFYAFGCEKYAWLIKSAAALIVVISIFRLHLVSKFRMVDHLPVSRYNVLRVLVYLNMICWSVIFTAVMIEHEFRGIHYIVSITMMCGFISASMITLSADLSLYLPFQLTLLIPPMCILTHDALGDNHFRSGPLLPVYLMYLLYQLKQVQDFRSKVRQNFIYQLELRQSNEELCKSQEAQVESTVKLIHTSRLAALGEMAAGIAHEVNNPLAIISGSLQQLERRISANDFTDRAGMMRLATRSQASIDRISKIIGGLRLFSQQSDIHPKQTVSLNHIVDDTLGFCSEMLKARYVNLEIGEIPQVEVQCHPVQISQVLINLIKNAEDALVDLKEEERWVKLTFTQNRGFLFIHVSNGGPKIPKDIQEKLFEPFFTTKAVGKGTGLGLSISQGIMTEHQGELTFNDFEKRTTFTISLPILS